MLRVSRSRLGRGPAASGTGPLKDSGSRTKSTAPAVLTKVARSALRGAEARTMTSERSAAHRRPVPANATLPR